MQRPFEVQRELFVSSVDLDHPALSELDSTESALDWGKLESLMSDIYASPTGRSSYPHTRNLIKFMMLRRCSAK